MKDNMYLQMRLVLYVIFALVLASAVLSAFPSSVQWLQIYAPVDDSPIISALVAFLPILIMFTLIGVLRRPAYQAGIAGLLAALATAVAVWRMPFRLALSSTLFGAAVALFPLLWTTISAVWFMNLLQDSGAFEIMKASLDSITLDRRFQALIMGYGFVSLLEGLVALTSPIAVGSGILVGFGFPPFVAAQVALLSDSHSAVWGPMGLPIMVLGSVSGFEPRALGYIIRTQAPLYSIITAPLIVLLVSGWRGLREIWWAALIPGIVYSAVIYAGGTSIYIIGVAAALAAMLSLLGLLALWKPKREWHFPSDTGRAGRVPPKRRYVPMEIARAWSPMAVLIADLAMGSTNPLREILSSVSTFRVDWPGLNGLVVKTPPVAQYETFDAVYTFPVLVIPGTLAVIAGFLCLPVMGISVATALRIYRRTLKQFLPPALTLVSVIGLGYLMNYSGLAFTLAVLLGGAGAWYPAVTVPIGVLGVAIGGSDTGANALFGKLIAAGGAQAGTGALYAASLLASGGQMGKSISFQGLALAAGAAGVSGKEGDLFRRLFIPVLAMTILMAAFAMLQYYYLGWMFAAGP